MLKNTTILIISLVGGCVCCCDRCTKAKEEEPIPDQPIQNFNVTGNIMENKKTLMNFIEKCPFLRQTVVSVSGDSKEFFEKLLGACAPFFSQYIQALDAIYRNVDDKTHYDDTVTMKMKLGFMKKYLGDDFANMVSKPAFDIGNSVPESEVSSIKQCVKKEVRKIINELNIFQQIGTGNNSLLKNFCKNLDNANDISNNRKILLLLYLMLKIDEGELAANSANYVAIKKDACNYFTHVLTNNADLTPDDVAIYICIFLNRNIDRAL